MKRHNRALYRLLCALALLLVLSLTLSLAACGDNDSVTPPNDRNGDTSPTPGDNAAGSGSTDTPGDKDDNGKDDNGKDDGSSGIPKQDTDPDGKDYGGLHPF